MVRKAITGWKRGALNIFISLHLAALLFWGLPDGPFRNHMAHPFERKWGHVAPPDDFSLGDYYNLNPAAVLE